MAAPPTRPPNFSALLQRQRSHVSASERMQASKAKYMAVASSIAVAPSIDCDEAWGPIAWSIDLVQHILEEQNAGMRAQGAGLSNEFFITAYSINVTVQQRAMRGAQILYERYANEMKNYLENSVLPAIRAKNGAAKLKEFAMRWENHKVLSEFMRRFFDIVDRGYVAGSAHESLSAISLRKFKNILFDSAAKSDMLTAMLDIVKTHRQSGVMDDTSSDLLKGCSEIFYTLGLTSAPNFSKIQRLVVQKGGKFNVPAQLEVLENTTQTEGTAFVEVGQNLSVYKEDYEREFLIKSQKYFEERSNECVAALALPDYMRAVKRTLDDEEARVARYMHSSTGPKLKKLIVECMLAEPKQTQLLGKAGSGLECQLANALEEAKSGGTSAMDNLALIFDMVGLVDNGGEQWVTIKGISPAKSLSGGHTAMADLVGGWMRRTGLSFVEERKSNIEREAEKYDKLERTPEFVYQLLDFHTQCVALVRERFNDAAVYKQKMRLAWEKIVNPPASLLGTQGTSEILSYFFDSVLRGSRGKNRLGVDDQKKWCAQAIDLWDYLNDKVLFMETYATHLMHRLLKTGAGGRFVSDHTVEQDVVVKLKSKHSASYTKKIETMFNDLTSAPALQLRAKYEHWAEAKGMTAATGLVKMKARLISRTSWPSLPGSQAEDEFALPYDLQAAQGSYTAFYAEKHEDRNVKFHKTLCTVTVKLGLKKCKATLTMDTVQCAVLALFREDRMVLSYSMLQTALNIDPDLLKRVIAILIKKPNHCNGGLLLKAPKGGLILPTDKFKFNRKFESKSRTLTLARSDVTNTANAANRAFELRKQYLEAAIVRILKANTTMGHADLVDEVKSQINLFEVQTRNVKLAIAGLIERKYVERHPTLEKTYNYKG